MVKNGDELAQQVRQKRHASHLGARDLRQHDARKAVPAQTRRDGSAHGQRESAQHGREQAARHRADHDAEGDDEHAHVILLDLADQALASADADADEEHEREQHPVGMGDEEIDRREVERSQARQHAERQGAHRDRDHDAFPAVGIDRLAGGLVLGVFGMALGNVGHERARQEIDGRCGEHDGKHGEGEACQAELRELVEKALAAAEHGAHREDQQARADERQRGVGLLQRIGEHRCAHEDAHTHHDQYFHDANLSSRFRWNRPFFGRATVYQPHAAFFDRRRRTTAKNKRPAAARRPHRNPGRSSRYVDESSSLRPRRGHAGNNEFPTIY